MTAKDAAERKRDERARMRARGFVWQTFWIHKADWPKVKAALDRLLVRRGGRKP